MGSPAGGLFAGLLSGINEQVQTERERKRKLDDLAHQAQLKLWLEEADRPDVLPQARADYLGRYLDTIAEMTGNKSSRKHLEPAEQFLQGIMQKVYPGRESRPARPAQDLPTVAAEGSSPGLQKILTPTLPPVPGVSESRGPYLTQEEMASRAAREKADAITLETTAREAAESPFRIAQQKLIHQGAMELEQARADGRVVTMKGQPDPRPGANEWDYVDILQRGDGATSYSEGKRPPAIERAYQMAKAIQAKEKIPLQEAWVRVWAQPVTAADTQEKLRQENLLTAPVKRAAISTGIANTQQGMQARGVAITKNEGETIATRVIGDVKAPTGTAPDKKVAWAITNIDDPRFYANDPRLSDPAVRAQVRGVLAERWNRLQPRPKAKGGLSLKDRAQGAGGAPSGGRAAKPGGVQVGQTVTYQGKPHKVVAINPDGTADLQPIAQ